MAAWSQTFSLRGEVREDTGGVKGLAGFGAPGLARLGWSGGWKGAASAAGLAGAKVSVDSGRGLALVPASRFGGVPEWLKGADCKSAGVRLRWFESNPLHHN